MQNDTRFDLRLPEPVRRELRDLSAQTGWSQTELLRGGVALLLEQRHRLLPRRPITAPTERVA
jgi:hypothetical protein